MLEVSDLDDRGGRGAPIVLLHGLMGRGTTWQRHVPWLREYGRVYTYDARFHRGRGRDGGGAARDADVRTEVFVNDLAVALEALDRPAALIGHSMGSLHAWCLAAHRPDLVSAVVVEDMAPDFRGRTTQPWDSWFEAWPVEFTDSAEICAMFGDVAGQYFLDSFDRTPMGWRLHGHIPVWRAIAAHWGTRDYWAQWRNTRVPALLLEGEHTLTPAGQMRTMAAEERSVASHYLRVPGTAHLIHDEAPGIYRGAVEAFLASLPEQ
ncbi:alpha/beta hydrolase [Hoyosella sp. YIM 151337]|uniref:alpha/beta fold hydrolase n=1 Tax=Hoyosella sp. YIM 151337 TaxID=2992742 RepID=UPI002235FFF0|nr:alpha/beta hydrolase [Hoyosella sp. YIM 151337]MCW4352793.1 alpha/beta hydrolase [Hoyosella sp. YIM 151337]